MNKSPAPAARESLVVERAVTMVPTGSVRGERAQEALLNRDAEGATDRNFALVEQGLV